MLQHLLSEVWKSPVFGDSFDASSLQKSDAVVRQMKAILDTFSKEVSRHISEGMPELNEQEIYEIVRQMAAKTVGFCPALSGGEINDVSGLSKLAVLIAMTGWGNQTTDRGDLAMPLAIMLLCNKKVSIPRELADLVQARLAGLRHIEHKVRELALPEDQAFLFRASRDELMFNEARIHALSMQYTQAKDKSAFLSNNAAELAKIMTITAALPSATTPLYAVYRRHYPELPTLREVYAEPIMIDLLQVCNTLIRVLDDLGDRQIDAGEEPKWGGFSLNLFNQPHPSLLQAFFKQAHVRDPSQVRLLLQTFAQAHTDKKQADIVSNLFLDHVRQYIAGLPLPIQNRYSKYIQLCKRALEAGYVNQVGDMALGDSA